MSILRCRFLRPSAGLSGILVLAAGLIVGGATRSASAPPETSRQALEKALIIARKKLPGSPEVYSSAMRAMIQLEPKRGAELIREALQFPKRGKWGEANVGYYLVEDPYGALLQKDFDLAVPLGLEYPERLMGHLGSAFHTVIMQKPAQAERWAPEIIKKQPVRGSQMIAGMIGSHLYSLAYLNQSNSGAEDQARTALRIYERFTPLLPPSTIRAGVKMQAGFHALTSDRKRALVWLQEAVNENPGVRPELDQGLWYKGQEYVNIPNNEMTVGAWRKVADQYRLLGSEAGVAGVVRRLATMEPAVALELAREIQDPSLRALAFSEVLEIRGNPEEEEQAARAAAALALATLFPDIERPVLRALVAYRLAFWQRTSEPKQAAVNFRLAYDLMLRHQHGPQGIFATLDGFLDPKAVRGLLLGHLSHYRPHDSMKLALSERKALGEHFPMVVFHAAAHAEDGRVAERWLRDYLPRESRDANRRAYSVCVTDEHPQRAAELVPIMPAGYDRDVFLVVVVPRLALEDPEAAVRLTRYFASDKARSAAYLTAAQTVYAKGTSAMLRMAAAVPLPLARADAMAFVVDQILGDAVTAVTLSEARKVAEAMPDEGPKWQTMVQIATDTGLTDVEAGMKYALRIDRYTERLRAESAILSRLVPKEIERALALAAQEPSEEGRVDLIASLANGVAEADPEAAVALAGKVEHRPTREQVLASAIEHLHKKNLNRALELAPQIVTRSAAHRAFPHLWLQALKSNQSPAKVWPLYRWLSHDTYSVSWVLEEEYRRNHPDQEPGEDPNVRPTAEGRTAEWLGHFPRAEWLGALQPHLQGEVQDRIDPEFLTRVAVRMADATPEDALALAIAARPDDYGWIWLTNALSKKHPEHAFRAAAHVRAPRQQVEVTLVLLKAAREGKASTKDLQQELSKKVAALASGIGKVKHPAGRARKYLELAQYLQQANQEPGAYLRRAREEAARVREPLLRAELLHSRETFPK